MLKFHHTHQGFLPPIPIISYFIVSVPSGTQLTVVVLLSPAQTTAATNTMKFSSLCIIATVATVPCATAFTPRAPPTRCSPLILHETATSTEFDLNAYLLSKKGPIEEALAASIVPSGENDKEICESMLYSLMAGGKRIRPVLCLAACEMFDPEHGQEKAMPAAVSLEMIHTMSLIHDDLPSMDNDDLRRGKPTNHVLYGEPMAILAGDALLSTSFQHVAQHTKGVDPERVLDVVTRLGASVGPTGLAGGQAMDIECENKDDTTLEDLRWIHTHKTATLLRVAVAAGAILGGATPEEVEACEKYAINIGLAFQVADDILDVTASTEDLGKTAGKDEDTNKTTYPKLMGLDGARKEAERLIDEAKEALAPFGERAAPLLAIADYIIDRKN